MLGLAAALALPASAWSAPAGQGQPAEDDDLAMVYGVPGSVSIATGSEQALRRAPAVASVITAADIAAMGATDLDQVLESVAGIHVTRTPNQYSPMYIVRGIVSPYTPQVLMLQNGIPITTAYLGNKGNVWAGYPVEHIARIEVLRGPGSALYGADAYSGVINIITKSAADTPGTGFGIRAGSFGTRDAWVQHGGKAGPVDVAVYLRAGSTDGFRRTIEADAQTRNDTLTGTHASLAPGPVNLGNEAVDANLDLRLAKWRFRAGYKLRDKVQTGAGIASALDPVGQSKSERITGDLSWTDPQFSRDWNVGVTLSTLHYIQSTPVDYQLFGPGLRFPTGLFPAGMRGGPDFWEQTVRLGAWAGYAGFQRHHLRVGAGHDDMHLYRTRETRNFNYTAAGMPIPLTTVGAASRDVIYLLPQRRRIDYLYLQDEWNLAPDWTLTTGVRHDHYSDFGGTTNPRLALVWDASLNLTAKLLYGRAFRAPAFLENYGMGNPVATGNPDLKPETNNTVELALAWQARSDTELNLTLYRYGMTNIIRTVLNQTPGTGSTYRNTGDQNGHGLELEAAMQPLRDLRLVANYSWQRSTDKASGADPGYAPRHHLYARAEWHISQMLRFGAQINYVAGRQRPPGDKRTPIADDKTVDLNLRSNHGRGNWDFSVGVRNLFNADVREPSPGPGLQLPGDLPMAPRALSLQASYQR